MRQKYLKYNILSSLSYQFANVACGFILPRHILLYFGSEVNGLTISITSFLGLISYLELGMTSVVESSLYKPLAEKDFHCVSKVVASARRFFRRIGMVFFLYVFALILIFPKLINSNFGFLFTATLILSISIGSFAKYFFGISDLIVLVADQKAFVANVLQIILIVLNTILCIIVIKLGFSIQLVKLTTSIVFLAAPIYYRYYVNRHHRIDRKIKYSGEPIKQKWNGIAQHVAAILLGGTDSVVLTVFSSLNNVSIYGVYLLVINGLERIFISATSGFQSYFGNLWANEEHEQLFITFDRLVWMVHTGVEFVFGCTAVLIVPFVQVYTSGIHDVSYNVPKFALLITFAYAVYCLRLPFNLMVLAAGHYIQTQNSYIISAALNIIISVIAVKKWGLVGVAIGTLIAMLYQTIYLGIYNSKYLVCWPMKRFIKQIIINIVSFVPAYTFTRGFCLTETTYVGWALLAMKVAIAWLIWIGICNSIFYRNHIINLVKAFQKR